MLCEDQTPVHMKHRHGRTSLHEAAQHNREKVIEILVRNGADVNEKAKSGNTPLDVAIKHGQEESIWTLLRLRTDPVRETQGDNMPLSSASDERDEKVIESPTEVDQSIEERARKKDSRRDEESRSEPRKKKRKKKEKEYPIQNILDQFDLPKDEFMDLVAACTGKNRSKCFEEDGKYLFTQAALLGNMHIMRAIFKIHPDILCSTQKYGKSALHLAAGGGRVEVVEFLCKQEQTLVHIKDYSGWTPLHDASKQSRVEVIEMLVRSGANINEKTKVGNTPLHVAVDHNQLESLKTLLMLVSVKTLLKLNADPGIENKKGRTPLQLALMKKRKEMFELLRESRHTHQMRATIKKSGGDVMKCDYDGRNILHLAANKSNRLSIEFALEADVSRNNLCKKGSRTVLQQKQNVQQNVLW